MSVSKTVAFGRMWRFTCDADDCEARETRRAGEVPTGWYVSPEEDFGERGKIEFGETVLCPTHKEGGLW